MPRALQAAALPRVETRQLPAAANLAALGIVYGDIGTSPLYAFKQAAAAGGTLSPETVMGVVSLILWSLILIVSLKYAILIMRADNHGEGGIVALLALLDVRHAPPRSLRAFLLIVGLIGAALSGRVLSEELDVFGTRLPVRVARPFLGASRHLVTIAHPEEKGAQRTINVFVQLVARVDDKATGL